MKIETKYDIGAIMTTIYPGGPVGMITQISIKADGTEYQLSYCDNGIPTHSWLMGVELEDASCGSIGFKK